MAGSHNPAKPTVSLKTTREEQQALLVRGEPFFFPAYVGPKGWIGIDLTCRHLDWTEVEELIIDSFRLVAPKTLAALLPAPMPGRTPS